MGREISISQITALRLLQLLDFKFIGIPENKCTTSQLGVLFYGILWATLGMIISISQIPTARLVIPVAAYLSHISSATRATIWSAIITSTSFLYYALKRTLLGKDIFPMLLILLGTIGGFTEAVLLRLFTRAIIFPLEHKQFITWLKNDNSLRPEFN